MVLVASLLDSVNRWIPARPVRLCQMDLPYRDRDLSNVECDALAMGHNVGAHQNELSPGPEPVEIRILLCVICG